MSYSQKQNPAGNSGGAPSNQASQQAAKALAGIQQQMQNLVHGQNSMPQSSQAGLNAFLTQQHYEILKQQQQQLLLSNPQLQQRFQQQMQQSKDRGEPLALTRTPAAADLLNKTYQQHHQQQSNGNNTAAPSLASVNQFQQQMQAANLMQQLHAYQLQFQQQQQQQQQHHQQPQQSHHQQQSSHQIQQKSHAQAASAIQSKQQHNQQMQQSQYSQKYMSTAAHSKSTVSGVNMPPPPPALPNQLKPPNLPPSTQITPIPPPQLTASNNNLSTKGSSSSAKQVPPSISLLPAKQPPVSLPNAPVAAHLHHHLQNKVPPISIPNQYNNPLGNKGPMVSAIPPPFPSHYQKISNQTQPPQMQQNPSAVNCLATSLTNEQEHKLQTSAVPLTKQQSQPQQQQHHHHLQPPAPSSSTVTSSDKAPVANQGYQIPAALTTLFSPVPAKETTDDVVNAVSSPPAAAQAPPPPPTPAVLSPQVPETKSTTPEPTPPAKSPTEESSGKKSREVSPAAPESNEPKPPSPPQALTKNGTGSEEKATEDVAVVADLPEATKDPNPEVPTEALSLSSSAPIQAEVEKPEADQNKKDVNTKSDENIDKELATPVVEKTSCIPLEKSVETSDDKSKPLIEEESPASDLSSTEVNKSNDTSNNISSSSDEQQFGVVTTPDKPLDKPSETEKKQEILDILPKNDEENNIRKSDENIVEKIDKPEKPEKIEKPEKPEKPTTKVEKNDKKQVEKPEKEKSEKPIAKTNQSEKQSSKSKTVRQIKSVPTTANVSETKTNEKKKDLSAVKSKTKAEKEDIQSTPTVEKVDKKKPQNRTKKSLATPITPSTPNDRKSQRHRLKTILYQSPLPELAFITKLSASEASNSPKPHTSNEDKLIVFYKNEYLAVRNAEGSFFLCQALQNVYRSSPRISIRWLSEDKNDFSVFTPDFYDHTDIECVLTTVDLKKVKSEEKGQLRLPETEKTRIENILKKAIDVEKGILPRPDVTAENPDGLDISLYKDESQIEKKSSMNALKRGSSRKRGRSGRSSTGKRNQSKVKSSSKKKKSVSKSKKKKRNYDGSDSSESDDESDGENDEDDDDSENDIEYKPSSGRKKSGLSSATQSNKSLRAQRSPLAKTRTFSPITPTSSRSKTTVPDKTETPASASSVNSRSDRALKRREGAITTPEIPTKKSTAVTSVKVVKGLEKSPTTTASTTNKTEEPVDGQLSNVLNKASTAAATSTSTKKIKTAASTTTSSSSSSTPSTSGTRPTRSRK